MLVSKKGLTLIMFFVFQKVTYAQPGEFTLNTASSSLPHIYGKKQNADYLYTTAGNRLYCIGNQAGSFPEVGFHVPGEMGGIWQQPVKLMDGFGFSLTDIHTGRSYIPVCDSFISYSFVTKFVYSIPENKMTVVQTQFIPDNLPVMVVEYKIQNTTSTRQEFEFEFHADINLMPVWLGERIGIKNGPDRLISFDNKRNILIFKDGSNTWFTGIGFEYRKVRLQEIRKTAYKGKGITGLMKLRYDLPAGASDYLRFYISGSTLNSLEIVKNISLAKSRLADLFEQKKRRYDQMVKTAEIAVPDTLVQKAYIWGKYATDWLERDVPGLGEGLSAGLPDYPWFFSNDQASTFIALTGTMSPQLFFHAFSMLKRISDKTNNSSGRIIHEVSANGVVYDKGKMQESQLHIIAAWQIFKWTGDMKFLKENYMFARKTWNWLQQHDTHHNGYIEGYGGTEIKGLNDEMLDVQVYTYRFLDILSRMASIFQDYEAADMYEKKATELKDKINKDWWVENESCYADFITSKEKALQIIDDALAKRVKPERNKWAQEKLNALKNAVINNRYPYRRYLVYYNAATLGPVIEGMTDTARALEMLKRVSFFTNKFGSYITGIERPDDITIDERSFQKDSTFNYNRAVMPAATAGYIIAAARYGIPDTALLYMHKVLNTFSYATPGTTYEVSPDYGMFVQAWNITSFNIPLIQYFFGIDPDAYKKEITMHLQMPLQWNEASLKNLLIGNTKFSVHYKKENDTVICILKSTEPGWKIHVIKDSKSGILVVNHKVLNEEKKWIDLNGSKVTIQYKLNK